MPPPPCSRHTAFVPLPVKAIRQRPEEAWKEQSMQTIAWENLIHMSEKLRSKRVPDLQFRLNKEITDALQRANMSYMFCDAHAFNQPIGQVQG